MAEGQINFGTFSSAHLYLLVPLIAEFHALHPGIRVRVVGLNSSEVADSVRRGDLEAGLVQLPVEGHNLVISDPVLTDEVVYASADPSRTSRPVTIDQLAAVTLILSEAHWKSDDPLRHGLTERAAAAGLEITPAIEVEFQTAALELAINGVGDTLVSYFVAHPYESAKAIHTAPLAPIYKEKYAFITRAGGTLSPETQSFMELTRRHIKALRGKVIPTTFRWRPYR